jgi:hypothetical protein
MSESSTLYKILAALGLGLCLYGRYLGTLPPAPKPMPGPSVPNVDASTHWIHDRETHGSMFDSRLEKK